MSKKIIITKEQLEQAIKNGYDSEKKLISYFNTSLSTIRRRLRENNIKLFKYSFDTDKFLILYNQGLNDTDIAKQLNIDHRVISCYRNKLKLKKNFSYKYENLKNLIISNYTNLKDINQVSEKLNIDKRLVKMCINEKPILPSYQPSEEEIQIILGSILGDGNLSLNKSKTKGHLIFAHSEKQKDYCIWKTEKLQKLMYYYYTFNKCIQKNKKRNKTYIFYRALSKDLLYFLELFKRWYIQDGSKNIKIINKEDLYKLDALGLAIWFQDDGYKEKKSGYCISTLCFSIDDLNIIKDYFKDKWNVDIVIRNNKEIYIGAKYRDKFKSIIEPYIHDDCKYKLL